MAFLGVSIDPPIVGLVVIFAHHRERTGRRRIVKCHRELVDFLADLLCLGKPAVVAIVLIEQAMPMLLCAVGACAPAEEAEELGAVHDALPCPQSHLSGPRRAMEISHLSARARLLLKHAVRE